MPFVDLIKDFGAKEVSAEARGGVRSFCNLAEQPFWAWLGAKHHIRAVYLQVIEVRCGGVCFQVQRLQLKAPTCVVYKRIKMAWRQWVFIV